MVDTHQKDPTKVTPCPAFRKKSSDNGMLLNPDKISKNRDIGILICVIEGLLARNNFNYVLHRQPTNRHLPTK